MKKIMFKDRYGLTQAVLDGRKTMTRRIIPLCERDLNFLKVTDKGEWLFCSRTCLDGAFPAYSVGEEVATAQPYKVLIEQGYLCRESDGWVSEEYITSPGFSNKMFVRADLMPNRIRITDIKAQRLQDITEEDCMREGVEKWMDCYIVCGIMERNQQSNVCFYTPREAFAVLIDKISGKGTWERNPWVWAYTFKMIR